MTTVLDQDQEVAAHNTQGLRSSGWVMVLGAVTMLVGAALYFSSGADAWKAVSSGDTTAFLVDAASSTSVLYAGLAAWSIGALTMAIGGGMVAGASGGSAGWAARTSFAVGAAVAIPAFLLLGALTRLAGAGSTSYELADTLAFLGTTLDDIATIIIIGLSPVLLALSGRRAWMPRWLVGWAALAGLSGLLSAVAIFLGQSASLGFAIVPIGIGWMIATGVVAVRRG